VKRFLRWLYDLMSVNSAYIGGFVDTIDPSYSEKGELVGVEAELVSNDPDINLPRLVLSGSLARRFAVLYGPGDYVEMRGTWSWAKSANGVFGGCDVLMIRVDAVVWSRCRIKHRQIAGIFR
jgi:hypothetical protein